MASAFGGYNFADAQDKRRQQREYGMILLRQAQEREQQKVLEKQSGMVNTKLNQVSAFSQQNQSPNNPFQQQPPLSQLADAPTPSRRGRRLRPISGASPSITQSKHAATTTQFKNVTTRTSNCHQRLRRALCGHGRRRCS